MEVRLIANTLFREAPDGYEWTAELNTDADELAEGSGRLCYLSYSRPNPKTATNEGYLANIIKQQHFSVMEHSSATFYVSGVSRAMLLELERHRFLSFSVVSQRYVNHGQDSDFRVVLHPLLEKYRDEVARYKMYMSWTVQDIVDEVQYEALDAYDRLVEFLMDKGHTRKEARGAARTVLPEGTETRFIVTGNVRAWRDVIHKRNDEAADLEIRLFAQKVLDELKDVAPNSFQDI